MSSNSICANCGKGEEESGNLKTCTACKLVKYCNRECQITHRSQHKKECKKREAELHDEKLFKQPPQLKEDCPICFLRLPHFGKAKVYMACCGKYVCDGCMHAVQKRADNLCPYCRAAAPNDETEHLMAERYLKRMELNDAIGICNLAGFYRDGTHGFPQNMDKAMELYNRAGELGHPRAYNNIGSAYYNGIGVGVDKKKAWHYLELAAMGGYVMARHNLGLMEQNKGNMDRALKHYMIAAKSGYKDSFEKIKELYSIGHATKDDYGQALRANQAYLDEIKSEQRDEAAAFDGYWEYY